MGRRHTAAALAALLALGGTAPAGGEKLSLEKLRDELAATTDSADRCRIVRQIAEFPDEAAARLLLRTAREDASIAVRCAASESLGSVDNPDATEALIDLALLGGVRKARAAVGTGIARRHDGVEAVARRLERAPTDPLDVQRLVDVLGDVHSEFAAAQLDFVARSADPVRRVAALRALSRNRKGGAALRDLLAETLGRFPDPDTFRTVLDLAFDFAGPDLRGVLRKFPPGTDAGVRAALESLHARLDYLDEVERRRKAPAPQPGYAPPEPEPPPVPPPPPVRIDMVLMFDATGSMWGTLDALRSRLQDDCDRWLAVGADLRVGVVAFRDRRRQTNAPPLQVLPLTYDLGAVKTFMDGLRTGGVDAQGTDVGVALVDTLDRAAWRPNALRLVTLVMDTRVGDPDRACPVAAHHFREDGTRLSVWYVRHTRTTIPQSLADLARAGGGDQSTVAAATGLEPPPPR